MEYEKSRQAGTATAAGRSVYESKVGIEAVARSGGKNPQLKGVVHEIMYRDTDRRTEELDQRNKRRAEQVCHSCTGRCPTETGRLHSGACPVERRRGICG